MDGRSHVASHGHIVYRSSLDGTFFHAHVALDDSVQIGIVVANGISLELNGIVILSKGIVDKTVRIQRSEMFQNTALIQYILLDGHGDDGSGRKPKPGSPGIIHDRNHRRCFGCFLLFGNGRRQRRGLGTAAAAVAAAACFRRWLWRRWRSRSMTAFARNRKHDFTCCFFLNSNVGRESGFNRCYWG